MITSKHLLSVFLSVGIILLFQLDGIAQYCSPVIDTTPSSPFPDFGITNVQLQTLNNATSGNQLYNDYTAQSTKLILGESYTISITPGYIDPGAPFPQAYSVWIDWNQDLDFHDAGEHVIANSTFNFASPIKSELFSIPLTATLGSTRMRVASTYFFSGFFEPDTCNQKWGEIEDYTVIISNPFNMNYVSTTATHNIETCLPTGSINYPMLKIDALADGNLNPLEIKNLKFNTNGSTNPSGDISNAKLWYTGNSGSFSLPTLLGTVTNPIGSFQFSTSQNLANSNNYFWLTYDINSLATAGNYVDAELTELTYDSLGINIIKTMNIAPLDSQLIQNPVNHPYTKQTSVWYFGDYAGVDFNCGIDPRPIDGGQVHTLAWINPTESSASISDTNGNLLFYAQGELAYNRIHEIMPHGDSLKGSYSSAGGAMIVPVPLSTNKYYLFINQGGPEGFTYSIVDMTLDAGLGDIDTNFKNVFVRTTGKELLASTYHCNGKDIWVTVATPSNNIISYLFDENGLIDSVSSPNSIPLDIGDAQFSPDGNWLAKGSFSSPAVLFEFDKGRGVVCNPIVLVNGYGVGFAPDATKLYVTSLSNTHQYDLTATNIPASKYDYGFFNSGSIQTGPNGKLYLSPIGLNKLSVIDSPNNLGASSNYNDQIVDIGGLRAGFSLPKYISNWFLDANYPSPPLIKADYLFDVVCSPDTTSFTDTSTYYMDCPLHAWNFDDPLSGVYNTSNLMNPKHKFTYPGIYSVRLILEERCQIDTVYKQVLVIGDSTYSNPNDTICINDFTYIGTDSNITGITSLWFPTNGLSDTTITNPVANPIVSTNYLLLMSNGSCTDTLNQTVIVNDLPIISISQDTAVCLGQCVQLNASGGNTYLWSPCTDLDICSNNNPITCPSTSILYNVQVTDVYGCMNYDSVFIQVNPNPTLDLGEDTFLCNVDNILLYANTNASKITWSTGDSSISIITSDTGLFWALATETNCSINDSVYIFSCPLVYVPNVFSPNGDGINDVFKIRGEGISRLLLKVYDRWGKKVFDTKNPNEGWNGQQKGKPANEGVYVYVITGELLNNTEIDLKGNVTLLR